MSLSPTFPWDVDPGLQHAYGFTAVRGGMQIFLGYVTTATGPVCVYANEKIGDMALRPWLQRWVPREKAHAAAQALCQEVEDYLASFRGMVSRPVENLDMDDFIEHIRIRTQHDFH